MGAMQNASTTGGTHLRGALDRLDHVVLVVGRRRGAREVVDLVALHEEGLDDVVLLLDAETTRVVATALSQSDILEHEVYLVERLDSDARGDQLFHLRAVAFLRPTRENVARLRRELRDPRFGGYHICEPGSALCARRPPNRVHCSSCARRAAPPRPAPPAALHRASPRLVPCAADFTNRVEDMRLQDLAEGDTRELVSSVQEYYGDFVALEPHHVAVPLARPHLALAPMSWDFGASSDMLARLTEGVAALMGGALGTLRSVDLSGCTALTRVAPAPPPGGGDHAPALARLVLDGCVWLRRVAAPAPA
jgi:hypothetical protein